MLEAEITAWINTIIVPFMPVITVFVVSALMLSDLPLNDDDDDDDGGGLISPVYNLLPQGAQKTLKNVFYFFLLNINFTSCKDFQSLFPPYHRAYSNKIETLMKTYLIAISVFSTAITITAIVPSIAYAL